MTFEIKKIEIPLSKTKLILGIGGSFLFIFAGIWLFTHSNDFQNLSWKIFRNPTIIKTVGITGVLFFGATGIYGIKKMFDKGILVFGPFPADGFFGSSQYEKYDAVVAAYHDQGLIPFKTLSFGAGVNYTAGLNKIRTSPDHGTAYEIAGKGLADHNSFKEAVYAAIDIYNSRIQHQEISSNPLKTKSN